MTVLTIDMLPDPLATYVANFAEAHPHLRDPKEADGQCVTISEHFVELLFHEGLYPYWQKACGDLTLDFEIEGDQVLGPPLPHDFFHDNGYGGHTVALVRGFCIDFTARQFGKNVPFPLIWKDIP